MRIIKFIIRRFVHGLFVIWGVVTGVFLLRFLTPTDPAIALTPDEADEEQMQALREALNLDDPIYIQYLDYLGIARIVDSFIHPIVPGSVGYFENAEPGLLQGHLGYSMHHRSISVVDWIFFTGGGFWDGRFIKSVELALAATFVAVIIAIPLGVISARRRHSTSDYGATMFSLVGISTPNFWLGIMLILLISARFGPIPTGGHEITFVSAMELAFWEQTYEPLWDWFRFMLLPAVTLGTYFTALLTRLTRSGMLEEIGKAYVNACRAKGLPETLTMYKHVLRNTLIPIITILGLQLGTLIGGAVITEVVFEYQGLGQLFINRINHLDWTMIQGIIIVIGVGFVVINAIVDALYAYLDPRVMEE